MEFSTIIKFKSEKVNYRNEASGVKRNTVRVMDESEDKYLQFVLKDVKFIKISCINNSCKEIEYMIRAITDITRFESHGLIIYIFSW